MTNTLISSFTSEIDSKRQGYSNRKGKPYPKSFKIEEYLFFVLKSFEQLIDLPNDTQASVVHRS